MEQKQIAPYVTPEKLLGNQKLPIECKFAIICYTPQPDYFKQFEIKDVEHTSSRYFIHTHNSHVLFCKSNSVNFIVISEVYGGPVSVTTVEELHYYGIKDIIGVGFVGSLTEKLPLGTIIFAKKALIEPGATPHYMVKWTNNECIVNYENEIFAESTPVGVWTTNALYREYPQDVKHSLQSGCEVVNMDTSHLYAAAHLLQINVWYYAVVTDVLSSRNEWDNNLMDIVKADSKQKSIVYLQQQKLLEFVVNYYTIKSMVKT